MRKVESEAQASAIRTLSSLTQGLGYRKVDYEFLPAPEIRPTVDSSPLEESMRLAADTTDPEVGRWD